MGEQTIKQKLPSFFHPILWSYDVARIDVEVHKKIIIVQALNYGDLIHWRWLVDRYGREEIQRVLGIISASEFRPRVQKLIKLVFNISEFAHERRSTE